MMPDSFFPFALMRRLAVALCLLLAAVGWLAGAEPAGAPVYVLPLHGAIGPASAGYLLRGMAHAQRDGAQLVVIEMDTPGGLDLSMREIIQGILASRVPVASYVYRAARAASAGTYIPVCQPYRGDGAGHNRAPPARSRSARAARSRAAPRRRGAGQRAAGGTGRHHGAQADA